MAGGKVSSSGSQLTLWRARAGLLYYRKTHGLPTAWAVSQLERGWHALRALKSRLAGRHERSAESLAHAALLARAWNDTLGVRVSPPRPW